jgi:eukaryotic translation initiation factor 2C
MILDRLQSYYDHKKVVPKNIIYFRDGVSAGHYNKVQVVEVAAIYEAFDIFQAKLNDLKPESVNLAAVVVTKRHHTRFYQEDPAKGDKFGNRNTHPGTCVDQLVTSPYYQDFFLQSHSGIKGTAKPTHYFVLQNDIPGLTLAKMRDLIHNLCYSYVRCMSGVSYISPTYYADRLCERGRLYIRKYYIGDNQTLRDELSEMKWKLDKERKDERGNKWGKREHKKTSEERDMEKYHADEVQRIMKDFVNKRIEDEFYVDRSGDWENPYAERLKDTMFWM